MSLARSAHASTSTPAEPTPPVGARYLARPAQPCTPPADASLLRRAIAAAGSSIAALARACGVCDTRAGAWASGEASISLRHILAAPASVRREVALALLATDEAPAAGLAIERHVLVLTRELGDVAEVVESGDRARLDRELADLIAAAMRARRDLGAA